MRGTLVSTLCLALLIGQYLDKRQVSWKIMGPVVAIVVLLQSPSVVYEAIKKSTYHSSAYNAMFFEWLRTSTDTKSAILPVDTGKQCAFISYYADALCVEKIENMHTKQQYLANPPHEDVTVLDFQRMSLPGMTKYVLSGEDITDDNIQFIDTFEGEYLYSVR